MNTRFNRRSFMKVLGAGAVSFALPGCVETAKKFPSHNPARPNVILVMTDDQGYGDLACHGNPIIKTPNLDKLYAQSTRLTNYHVGPTCSPTRAGLNTGHYCNRTGLWHTIAGRSQLRKDEVTMADVFSQSGYRTGCFGKWHMGDNYPFRPQDRGFQEVLIHGGGGVTQTPDYWNNDYFDDTYFHNGTPKKYKGYCTDIWFDGAMRFIEDNRDRPFFAYLVTNAPHGPFHAPQKYLDMYAGNDKIPNTNFYAMITNIDDNMARLRNKVAELGLEDNTIFIFTTDNGTAAGYVVDRVSQHGEGKGFNAGMRGKKGSEYDGGHRVPFFVRWPAGEIPQGRDIDRVTAHIDVLPTLIDLCDLTKPKGVKFDGTSIKPLLYGNDANWPDRVLITDSQRVEHPIKWRRCATMTDRWRLINGTELYDMKADPGQKNDIAKDRPEVVKRLRAEYEKWWASVSERFDEYTRTIIGSDAENPVTITCHDWHGPSQPWNQNIIRSGQRSNGFWAVDIARDGEYEFALRRWPRESGAAINASVPPGDNIPGGKPYKAGTIVNVTKARLKIGDFDESKPVRKKASEVTFKANLKKGKARLETWFTDEKGASRGAYYVYVKRLS